MVKFFAASAFVKVSQTHHSYQFQSSGCGDIASSLIGEEISKIILATNLQRFTHRLQTEWLPAFCADPKRQFSLSGFKESSVSVTDFDAGNFLKALDSGLVYDAGGGRYHCARSNAQEQIFWEGLKSVHPRPLTLWLEPVITIATMARLRFDFGWTAEVLGMQSKDWAFDFAVYRSATDKNERIAGEVKKSKAEIDELVLHLRAYGHTGATAPLSAHSKHINSFKKWTALLRCRAPLFWAVGPGDYTRIFEVQYGPDGTAVFSDVDAGMLCAPEFEKL